MFPSMRTRKVITLLAWFSITIGSAQEWPVVVKPPTGAGLYSKVEDTAHQYRTRHFEIISFQDHREQILKSMASCAESVPAALQAIPLPLYAPPVSGQSKIHIFKNEDSYEEAGGAKGTAGFYESRQQTSRFPILQAPRARPGNEPLLARYKVLPGQLEGTRRAAAT